MAVGLKPCFGGSIRALQASGINCLSAALRGYSPCSGRNQSSPTGFTLLLFIFCLFYQVFLARERGCIKPWEAPWPRTAAVTQSDRSDSGCRLAFLFPESCPVDAFRQRYTRISQPPQMSLSGTLCSSSAFFSRFSRVSDSPNLSVVV